MSPNAAHRRSSVAALIAVLMVAFLASCASGGGGKDAKESGSSAGGEFPVTIKTTLGSVTVDKTPQRVVALTGAHADALYALGIDPIAVTLGTTDGLKDYPWLAKHLDTELIDEGLVNADFAASPEKIAALKPDLILGFPDMFKKGDVYEKLSKVAPVVTGIDDNDAWQTRLELVATAVGMSDKLGGIVDAVHQEFDSAAAAAPQLTGATYQWVRWDEGAEQFYFGNGSLFELFGLIPSANQDNTQNTDAALSFENLDQLDADVLAIWAPGESGRAKLEADPRFANLPSVKNNAVVWADLPMANAINSPGPSALSYVVSIVAPTLQQASTSTAK